MDHQSKGCERPRSAQSSLATLWRKTARIWRSKPTDKAVNLNVSTHEAMTPLEAEGLATVYAHEAMLAHRNGRKTRATGTWQEHQAPRNRRAHHESREPAGANRQPRRIARAGLEDLTFEAFVLRHEALFSPAAVQLSKERFAVTGA